MATVRPSVRDYVLGNSPREQERLKFQASIVGGWTETFARPDWIAACAFSILVAGWATFRSLPPKSLVPPVASRARPGGIVCFHEMAFGHPVRSYPDNTLWTSVFGGRRDFRRAGADPDAGLRLTSSFLNTGLPRPNLKPELPIGGEAGSYLYGWIAETLRTLLPKFEQFGLACPEEMQIDTLAQRMETDAVELRSELIGPIQFGAWVRKV